MGFARGIAVYQEETVFHCIQSFTTDSYFGNGKDNSGYHSGADPGFFLGGGAPLRNGVTDW